MESIKAKAAWGLFAYKFKRWMFSWQVDAEGDLVFSIAHRIHFVKYKEHTVFQFGKQSEYQPAPKYVR